MVGGRDPATETPIIYRTGQLTLAARRNRVSRH